MMYLYNKFGENLLLYYLIKKVFLTYVMVLEFKRMALLPWV